MSNDLFILYGQRGDVPSGRRNGMGRDPLSHPKSFLVGLKETFMEK